MTINDSIVSREDFGDDLSQYSGLSGFDMLAIVTEKAIEKLRPVSPKIRILMSEQPKPIVKTSPSNPKLNLKRKRIELRNPAITLPPPALPQEFKDRIVSLGGSDPTLVIEKTLTSTDVEPGEARISMPGGACGKLLNLTAEETNQLELRKWPQSGKRDKIVGIPVKLIDPKLNELDLIFKRWEYSEKSCIYVLSGGWNKVVANNDLRKDEKVQLWKFRIQGKLAFALVLVSLKWGAKRKRGSLPTVRN